MLAIYTNYIINTVKFSDVNKAFIVGQDNTQINFDNTNPTLNDNLIENYIFLENSDFFFETITQYLNLNTIHFTDRYSILAMCIVSENKSKRLKFSNTSKPEDLEAFVSKMESDDTYTKYEHSIGNEDFYEYEDGLVLRVNKDTGETKVELVSKNDIDNAIEKDYTKLTNEEIDYEFRRIQESSKRLLKEFESGDTTYRELDEGLRKRYSECIRRQLEANVNRNANVYESNLVSAKKGTSFGIYSNVNGELFHNSFETIKPYIKQNELVDLHSDYSNAKCFLSEDGLQGFAITNDGNLISVFNADSNKRGYIDAIKEFVKEKGATHLDCYGYLAELYSKEFGFKVASEMDYNMEYDHHNIAKNYNEPTVSFLVKTDEDIETKHFTKDQYDEAVAYQQRFINGGNNNSSANNKINTNQDTFGQINAEARTELIKEAANDTYVTKKAVDNATDRIIKGLKLEEDIKVDIKQETKDR